MYTVNPLLSDTSRESPTTKVHNLNSLNSGQHFSEQECPVFRGFDIYMPIVLL